MNVYQLTHEDMTIGIFSKPEFNHDKIKEYFGEFKLLNTQLIEDSGIEWVAVIECGNWTHNLCMSMFTLDEIS